MVRVSILKLSLEFDFLCRKGIMEGIIRIMEEMRYLLLDFGEISLFLVFKVV